LARAQLKLYGLAARRRQEDAEDRRWPAAWNYDNLEPTEKKLISNHSPHDFRPRKHHMAKVTKVPASIR